MIGTSAARGRGEGEDHLDPQMQQHMMENTHTTMCQQPVIHQQQQPVMYQRPQRQPMMNQQQLEIVSQPQQPVVVMNQQPIMMNQSAFQSTFLKEKEPKVFGCWKTKTFLKSMLGLTALWGVFWILFSCGWMVPVGGGLCLLGALVGGHGMGQKSTICLTVAQIIIGFGTCFLFAAPIVSFVERGPSDKDQFWSVAFWCQKPILVFGILTVIGYMFIWIITMNRYKKHISKVKRVTAPVLEDLTRDSYTQAWGGHQAIRQ